MNVTKLTFIALAIIFHSFGRCQCLRCRSDDGPTDDELRKIAQTCMHRVGENESEEDDNENNSSDGNNDDNNNGHSNDRTNSNRQYNNENHHNFNFQSEYQNDPYANMGTYQGRNGYMYNNRNNQNPPGRMNDNYNPQNTNRNQFDPRYENGDMFNNGNYNSFGSSRGNNRNFSNNNNNFRTNNNDNYRTQKDRACLMHCFFHELKMTNNEDMPDQRKMLQVLTMDMRNHEIKQFYVDSIQECFHLVDNMDNYNRRKDQCDVAYKIVTCLSERAKTNCDDYQNDMMMF